MKKQSRRQNHRSDDDTVAENVLEDSSAPAEPEGGHVMSDVEIETLIQQHEAELRANPKGLDVSSTLVKRAKPGEPPELKEVPCIGKYWINDIEKKPYVLPTEFKMPNFGKNRSGEVDYYKKHFKDYNETFHNLVTLQFKFFWSTIIYNSRILPLIHSFLDVFPKPWSRPNTVFADDADVRELSDEFLALVKQTLIRLTTRSESASMFLTPAGYTQILSANHVFPARCIISACAQYGASDPEFCTAIRSLIDDYENIATDSLTAGKDILRDFETSDVTSALCAQLMHSDLKCVLDAAASIASVLRVCPAVVDAFYKSKLLVMVQEVYNTVAEVEVDDDDRAEHILKCLIACAAHVVNGRFIAKLREWYRKMDPKDRSNSYDALIGELIEVITQWNTVPSKRFLCDFAKSTHLGKRVSRLANEFPNTM